MTCHGPEKPRLNYTREIAQAHVDDPRIPCDYSACEDWLMLHDALWIAEGRIADLERDRKDMAVLIRRLLYRLRCGENAANVRQQAIDYLLRKGLGGSLLRAEKEAGGAHGESK